MKEIQSTTYERMQITQGDITKLSVDAIVNAANSSLLGGGGVDGGIHRGAGPGLLEECRKLGGCETGQAKITKGYELPARYVIHAVGRTWGGGAAREAELLASGYASSLDLAVKHDLKTIAFSAISCGIYGYPIDQAASIAVSETSRFFAQNQSLSKVLFVCFNVEVSRAYEDILRGIQKAPE